MDAFEMDQHHLTTQVGHHEYLRIQLATHFPDADEATLRDTLEGLSNLPEMIAALVRSELGEEGLRRAMASFLEDTLEQRTHSDQALQRYAAACPVENAQPIDYALQEIRLADDDCVLAGIHFQGLEVREPFAVAALAGS